jgi:hypothetical protein
MDVECVVDIEFEFSATCIDHTGLAGVEARRAEKHRARK